MMNTLVMKFGGASVATIEQFSQIADIIISRLNSYSRIVVVISAMGKTTNQLITLAKQVHPHPPQREYDMLISVGERISMSLLAMALWRKKVEAISFTGSQSGIITCNHHTNAQIIDVRPHRVLECLDQGKVVIIAGFQGVSQEKEITTLGRGGSDTSAVALALALSACKVEFFKDVPGIFNEDPKQNSLAVQYPYLTYKDALEIIEQGAKVLHSRAIELAAKNGLPLHVRSFMSSYKNNEGTLIHDPDRPREKKPLYEEVLRGLCYL
jgi:aspartate kinase